MKFYQRKSVLLLLLIVLFISPGLAAVLFYQHPQWLSGASVNKGDLINPPFSVKALAGHWNLILWQPQRCDKACVANLEKAHRILLALGRQYYQIKLWCLQDEQSLIDNPVFEKMHVVHTLGIAQKDSSVRRKLGDQPRFFIANAQGFLILSYLPNASSQDIYHDLKQLFRVNEK